VSALVDLLERQFAPRLAGLRNTALQEWSEERSLDWHLLENRAHSGIQSVVRDLNRAYCDTRAGTPPGRRSAAS
jgi:hypothetical protein